ncbi:MAG TPA: APC family permease [Candidatus Saccharimonadales bacterium]|nr:APC family permease [Candidatus Saccharimonadales bacterium]
MQTSSQQSPSGASNGRGGLERGLTLLPATALNMVDMIGVGPFVTLPLMVAAMHGPQAIYGWIAGAVLALSDGLIWAELGAAMPRAGGSYEYLKQIYGPQKFGRLLSFLFVFQLVFSAPVSMATGCIGLAGYAAYVAPALGKIFWRSTIAFPLMGTVRLVFELSGATLLAMLAAAFATFLVYRNISGVGRVSKFLWVGVIGTLGFVIYVGLSHFNSAIAFPPGWATPPASGFEAAFAGALMVALYDYWGYYNICFLGEEVVDPGKTIPRSMLLSIGAVACLYIAMNISVLGVMPAADIAAMARSTSQNFVVAKAAEVVYGRWAGTVVAVLVIWTAFASVFSLLAGYSRIPFAAARDGNFFTVFSRVHPRGHFPTTSVLLIGGLACLFCVFQLRDLVSALVVIRILLLFLLQAVGAVVWRITNPTQPRPFRMWLYPLPVLITLAGFSMVLLDKLPLVGRGMLFTGAGIVAFLLLSLRTRKWPFTAAEF